MDKKMIIYIVSGIIILAIITFIGYQIYKSKGVVKQLGNNEPTQQQTQTQQISVNKPVYESLDKAIDKELDNIKYDLMSILYSSMKHEEFQEFMPQRFVIEISKEELVKMQEDVKKKTKSSGAEEIKLPEDTKEIKKFLELTQTNKKDYKDFIASFYPDKGCIIIIYKPSDGKEVLLEQAIKNGISKVIESIKDSNLKTVYSKYIYDKHNNYYILIAHKNANDIKTNIVVNMSRVDDLIKRAVEQQYKK